MSTFQDLNSSIRSFWAHWSLSILLPLHFWWAILEMVKIEWKEGLVFGSVQFCYFPGLLKFVLIYLGISLLTTSAFCSILNNSFLKCMIPRAE